MGTRTIKAMFAARAHAEQAQQRLRELGIGADRIEITGSGQRTSQGRSVDLTITAVVDGHADEVVRMLEQMSALSVDQREEDWPPPGQSWMDHHSGRVTGTKVSPGQGDAETGPPLPPEAGGDRAGQGHTDRSEA